MIITSLLYSSWIFKNICIHVTLSFSAQYLVYPQRSDCSDHGDAIGRDVNLSPSNTHFINN